MYFGAGSGRAKAAMAGFGAGRHCFPWSALVNLRMPDTISAAANAGCGAGVSWHDCQEQLSALFKKKE